MTLARSVSKVGVAVGADRSRVDLAARTVCAIVPIRNDRPAIRECLDALRAQAHPFAEVIAVDRGSRDGSVALLERERESVRVVHAADQRDAVAAALGLASSDVVVLVPARARLAPDAVERCIRALADGHNAVEVRLRSVGTTSFGRAVAATAPHGTVRAWARESIALPTGRVWKCDGVTGWLLVADTPAAWWRESFEDAHPPLTACLLAVPILLALGGRWSGAVAAVSVHVGACGVVGFHAGRAVGVARHQAFLAAAIRDWSSVIGWSARRFLP